MSLGRFCLILALCPIIGLPLYFLGYWTGICSELYAATGLCEVLGLAFPWGFFATVPAAAAVGIVGFVMKISGRSF